MSPKHHCIDDCKLKGKETKEMLRCCGCNKWFHYPCVEEDPKQPGIWNCSTCSQQSSAILTLVQDVLSIKCNIGAILRVVDKVPEEIEILNRKVTDLSSEIKQLQSTNDSLVQQLGEQQQENVKLCKHISDLEVKLAKAVPDSTVIPSTTLLIGSSMIRDLSSTDNNLTIKSISGAKVSDITEELEKCQEKYDNISIVVGGNDCDDDKATSTSVTSDMNTMIDTAKKTATHVKISSILPRIKSKCASSHLKIDQINQNMKRACDSDSTCEYIDHYSNFTLADKSANDALYHRDGVHLNFKGCDKLINNLGLSKVATYNPRNKRKSAHQSTGRSNPKNPSDWNDHSHYSRSENSADYNLDNYRYTYRSHRNNYHHSKDQRNRSQGQGRQCYGCGAYGHIQRFCVST